MNRLFFALAVALALPAAQAGTNEWNHLRNNGAGLGQCLDIVNDGVNNMLKVADCGNFSGQFWKLVHSEVPGYYKLQSQFTTGARCLDVINDATNDRVWMASCANVTGQQWNVTRLRRAGRSFQLSNRFTGPSRCLEATTEGLHLRTCDHSPGQRWRGE